MPGTEAFLSWRVPRRSRWCKVCDITLPWLATCDGASGRCWLVAVGVRTAQTLANAQLWQQVHRAGGYATVALGIVVAVTGVVAARDVVGPVVVAAAVCASIPVVVSYRRHAGA